jgi:hypothetical protein
MNVSEEARRMLKVYTDGMNRVLEGRRVRRAVLTGLVGYQLLEHAHDHASEENYPPEARMVTDPILSASTASAPRETWDWRDMFNDFQSRPIQVTGVTGG